MFKKVYQFAFAFVFLLTCSFFVSDKVFAYSNDYFVYLDYSNSKVTNVVNSSDFSNALSAFNNLSIDYSQFEGYIIYFKVTSNSITYYLDLISECFNNTCYSGGGISNKFDARLSRYSSSEYDLDLNISNYHLLRYTYSNGVMSSPQIYGSTTSSLGFYIFSNYSSFYNGYNLYANKSTFTVFYYSSFHIPCANSSNSSQGSNFINVKVGDNFCSDLGYFPTYLDTQSIELDTKINGSNSNQLNSIDVYLDSTVENDGEYNFSLAIQDLYDYTNSNASYGDISGFSFKGLVNDNGLYHWETITDRNNFYVDYDDDDWTNNSLESCLNTENSSSGCTGYSFKGTAYYDMTGYEQIKFSIDVYNTREYFIKYDDDYDSVSSDYIDLNYYFLGDETGQRYGRTSSKGYRYMFFSAYGDLVNTELNNYYVIIRSNHYNQYNDVPIFFNKFNNSSYYFLDYDDNNVYTLKKLNNYTYLRYAFEIGETSATGFYTDLNADDIFTYEVYIPDNLYFSYTNDVTESTFINSSGEVVDDGIFPDTNISITNINSYSNIFESALHYFTEPIRFIFLYFGDFFDTLPIALKYTLISTFTLSIVIIVIKFII